MSLSHDVKSWEVGLVADREIWRRLEWARPPQPSLVPRFHRLGYYAFVCVWHDMKVGVK